jgi:hypothetical protein
MENIALDCLINEVKEVIKKHRNSETHLENKTYDMIFSSISHWSMAASEKIYALYEKHFDELNLISPHSMRKLDMKDVQEFIKYRNNITHGSTGALNIQIAETAYILCGLVYCCILTRIGMPKENIKKLCGCKILS